jgi:predicted transcriptional regulator
VSSEEPPPPSAELPELKLTDARAIRALAHPVRVALLEAIEMADNRTLTATEASELLGESPANCAFHLRTLAKYGFLTEAGGGRGRERPWRRTYRGLEISPPGQDHESRLAAEAAGSVWISHWLSRARDRVMRALRYPADWQDAVIAAQRTVYLAPAEVRQLGDDIRQLLEPFQSRRDDPAQRPPGSLPVEVLVFGYPLTDPPPDSGPRGESARSARED